ncbi:hypothetical protein CPB83DRAFT_906488 [Crepidotus variabilis]|uniref:DUF4246 domain-containing protein n=1 Tax=Crepidotus variabilis TaxID=179855 RepID=A0A9P6EHE3_9AGAR|nr:hypothetical protein CPB83DRAFT_906488 [Crepidotus variabilis]
MSSFYEKTNFLEEPPSSRAGLSLNYTPTETEADYTGKVFPNALDPGLVWDKGSYSQTFQWLPCELDISGERARITSYINNLHPKETKLYKLVAQVIDVSIPFWNTTFTLFAGILDTEFRRVHYTEVKYDPDPWLSSESEGPQNEKAKMNMTTRYEGKYGSTIQRSWYFSSRESLSPPPLELKPSNLKEKFGEEGLQVIVKFANIELTPNKKPKYEGGSWHIEGQLNEHIVSTSIDYYSSENTTHLLFHSDQRLTPISSSSGRITNRTTMNGSKQSMDVSKVELLFKNLVVSVRKIFNIPERSPTSCGAVRAG